MFSRIPLKPIRMSAHASLQAEERGATIDEIHYAINNGVWEPAKRNRNQARANFQFGQIWNGKAYNIKQAMPVFLVTDEEIIVVTIYTFYF